MALRTLLLAVLLLLSGMAGLSYEVVWLRGVTNGVGSSTAATSLVLAVFMGGMALGSLCLGRVADRVQRPLWWFAALEVGIGLWALLMPTLLRAIPAVDRALSPDVSPTVGLLVRGAAATGLLLIPTMLMGATLPAIAAHLSQAASGAGRRFALLYGVHVAGAAAGCLVASFALIPSLGLSATSRTAAIVNGLVALFAFLLGRKAGSGHATDRLSTPPPPSEPLSPTLLRATALVSGLILLGSEVVFVRTLVMALSAKVHSFALMLAVFLVGLSLGSLLLGLLPARWRASPGTLVVALACGAAGLLVAREVPLRLAIPWTVGAAEDSVIDPTEYIRLALGLSAASLLPVAIPLGMVLPWIFRRTSQSAQAGRATGTVIFWNTLGSVSGPLLATYVLVPRLGLQGTLYGFAAAAALLAVAWSLPAITLRRGVVAAAAALALVAAATLSFGLVPPRTGGTPELDASLFGEARMRGTEPVILEHHEGATGTVTVTRRDRRNTLRLDGFEAAGVPGQNTQAYQYMRLMAHFPMLLRGPEETERALVICCGTGTTAGALTVYPVQHVDLVDIHPEVLDCLHHFAEFNRNLHVNPRCRRIAEDGRSHLRRHQDYYDVVTLEPMPPQHAGMTQLYSVEFYEDCKRALRDGGVVCQWLPYHLMTADQALAITKAMATVFETTQVWEHHQTGILLGCNAATLPLRREAFDAAWAIDEVQADLRATGLHDVTTWTDGFLCRAEHLDLGPVDPIRDDDPFLEYADVGFGLSAQTREEFALIRAPFFAARLNATLPLEGFSADDASGLTRAWREQSVARYVTYLHRSGNVEEARRTLNASLQRTPFLRGSALMERIAAQLGRPPPTP